MTAVAKLGAAMLAVVGAVGCFDDLVLNQMISTVRNTEGSTATLHDFDLARQVSESSIGQLEAFHRLDPDDSDVHYMLTRSWTAVALRFMLDAEERARTRGDGGMASYHRLRLRAALKRARFYARRWMMAEDDGFERAAASETTLRAWLDDQLDAPDDASILLWAGAAWLGYGWTFEPPSKADVTVGRVMLEQSATGSPGFEHGLALTLLALDEASRDPAAAARRARRAYEIESGRYLPAGLALALTTRCMAGQAPPEASLSMIAESDDPLPAARLDNLVAIRLARRYLEHPGRVPFCREVEIDGARESPSKVASPSRSRGP